MLRAMILRALPLAAGLLPIFAVFTSYWIAINTAGLPSCNPFLDGCTSVSATGRHPPASFLFKGVMLPQSILLVAYWLLNVAWLRAISGAESEGQRTGYAIGVLGVTGSLFLIVYVTFLGSEVPFYEFMRRYGVYLYFALNVFAQIALATRALPFVKALGLRRAVAVTRLQLVLAWVPFALGALNLVLKATLEDSGPAEARIEWIFAMQMQLYFLLTWFLWRDTRFSARFAAIAPQPAR